MYPYDQFKSESIPSGSFFKKNYQLFAVVLLSFITCICSIPLHGQPLVIYAAADGTGDGSSYNEATALPDALTQAQSADSAVVYLVPGTYELSNTLEVTLSTDDKSGIHLIGGIMPDGTISHDRDITIIDGGNTLQILRLNAHAKNARLNMGVTGITFRNALTSDDGNPATVDHGGAISAYEGNWDSTGVIILRIEHCTFMDNKTSDSKSGGAIYSNCLLYISDCEFLRNEAYNGGAIMAGSPASGDRNSVISIEECEFEENKNYGNQGSSIWHNLTLKIRKCMFHGMLDGSEIGPGSCVWGDSYSTTYISQSAFTNLVCKYWGSAFQTFGGSAYIDNCIFKDNKAGGISGATDGYGALAFYHNSRPATTKRITNCTFSGNYSRYGASTYGGAIHNRGLSSDDFLVSNCIFWGNGTMPVVTQMGVAKISFSNIEGGMPTGFVDGGNNINSDPLFSDQLLHIQKNSPCYNTGTNTFEPQATEDFEGHTRILSGVVDMGAYEINTPPDSLWLSNLVFAENLDSASVVATVSGRDPDPEDAGNLLFGLIPGDGSNDIDNHLFALDGQELKFLAVGDYETDSIFNIHIGIMDPNDGHFEKAFTLKLLDSNDPVEVTGSVTTPQSILAGQAYSYSYPEDLFYDQDGTENLAVTAGLENGYALPDWLIFDAPSRTFSGTPENDDADSLVIEIHAEDPEGSSASVTFGLKVEPVESVENPEATVLQIYPNPAHEYITVRFRENEKFEQIRILTLNGACIIQQDHTNGTSCKLDLHKLTPGIYILEAVGQKCRYMKLVKQ
jgi:hypothetical protein